MLPSTFNGKSVYIVDIFEAIGAVSQGKMTEDELEDLENCACPGA